MAGSGPRGRVLVVDDDESLRLLCRVNLELDGYRVLEAPALGRAREILAAEPVDVVLLDLDLGGRDGGELLSELRSRRAGPAVVLFTGSSHADEPAHEPADGFLPKPFSPDQLRTTVQRLTRPCIDSAA